MNCNNNKELRIVRGNAFSIKIHVEAVRLDGTKVEDFDLSQSSAILKLIHAGVKNDKEFMIDGNNAIISFDGAELLGWYGVEMTGAFQNLPWRFQVNQVFQIVETNEKANVPSWTILTDSTYFVEGVLTLYAEGSSHQADWNETDPQNPSYIKNKPDLSVFATKEELNIDKQTLQQNITAEESRAKNAEQTLQQNITAEESRAKNAEQTLQQNINSEANSRSSADQTLQGNINAEQSAREAADTTLDTAINAIKSLIPSSASANNKLADIDYVNNSVSTSTAEFRGTYNVVSDLHLTAEATHAQIEAAIPGIVTTADNDYVFVQIPTSTSTPTQIASIERYKFNDNSWVYEYTLNNSGYTAAQWNAINSGITNELVMKLAALPTNDELTALLAAKQNALTFDNAPTESSNNPVKSGGIYSAIATAVSGLLNTSQVQSLINTALQPYSTTEQMTQAISGAITTALADYYTKTAIDTLLSAKVDKVSGKQLSTEDFTTALKTKLDNLPTASDLATQIQTAITTALASYYTKTQTDTLLAEKQTAAQVSTAISSALASYSTTQQMNTAISNALASYYTKAQTDTLLSEKVSTIRSITWSDLVDLRDDSDLIPGQKYRITDFVTTTALADTQSANHAFDIVVTALDPTTLDENATVMLHNGDTYFASANLEAWKVKYCIDNDTNRFTWADTVNGKGVIYWMKDEFNNECGYDFKNIMFKRSYCEVNGSSIYAAIPGLDVGPNEEPLTDQDDQDTIFLYTFSCYASTSVDPADKPAQADASMGKLVSTTSLSSKNRPYNNTIEPFFVSQSIDNSPIRRVQSLPNITFMQFSLDDGAYTCNNNHIGGGSHTLSCFHNIEDLTISGIVYETYLLGSMYYTNISGSISRCYFSGECDNCTFSGYSENCTFSGDCYACTFSGNLNYNTFSGYCGNCTFSGDIEYNTFSGDCYNCTFSGEFYNCTFSGYCYACTFSGNLSYNTFSGDTQYSTFAGLIQNAAFNGLLYCTFDCNCNYVTFGTAYQHIRVFGEFAGTEGNPIDPSIDTGAKYVQVVTGDGNGGVVIVTPYI